MTVFSQFMPHIYEELKDYRPKKRFIYMEESGELNLFREDIGFSSVFRKPQVSSAR